MREVRGENLRRVLMCKIATLRCRSVGNDSMNNS